jgi:hypothetical protein
MRKDDDAIEALTRKMLRLVRGYQAVTVIAAVARVLNQIVLEQKENATSSKFRSVHQIISVALIDRPCGFFFMLPSSWSARVWPASPGFC